MKFYVPIIAALLLFASCKKEQPFIGETKDICECLKEKRSSFFMGERFGDQNIDLDTILMPVAFVDGDPSNFIYLNDVLVHFESYHDAISYEWWIGSDPTPKTTKSFSLFFQDSVSINVRLIMTSEPNTVCFPNDDGIDTIDRVLTIRNQVPHPMWGSYYGYDLDDPGSPYIIQFDTLTEYFSNQNQNVCREVITNLPNGKMRPVSIGRQFGSMTYSFQGCADAPGPYNDIIYVEDINSLFENSTRGIFNPVDNTIRITYYTREIIDQFQLGSEYQEHVFVGTKL